MKTRHNTLLWMKDLIEHMARCQEQLQWASDGRMETFLAETLIGDLAECRKLCEELRGTKGSSQALSAL